MHIKGLLASAVVSFVTLAVVTRVGFLRQLSGL